MLDNKGIVPKFSIELYMPRSKEEMILIYKPQLRMRKLASPGMSRLSRNLACRLMDTARLSDIRPRLPIHVRLTSEEKRMRLYSSRRTCMGSTRDARREGMREAAAARV